MKNPDSLTARYQPLKTRYSETPVLVIDTEADPFEILDAARQRIRAASDLLETLYCTCFKQAEASDIPKICLLYTSPSPRDGLLSRMPSSA